MTPYRTRLTPLTQRMAEDMLVRNLSANTIDAYTYHVGKFIEFAGRPAEELGPEQIREFQLHLIRERKVGWSSFNQAVCGLRLLYRFTIPRDWHVEMIPFGKRPKKLPPTNAARRCPLGHEQAARLIECATNLKHRTVLLTLYAAGLRLSEATHLKVTDIDSARMQLRVGHRPLGWSAAREPSRDWCRCRRDCSKHCAATGASIARRLISFRAATTTRRSAAPRCRRPSRQRLAKRSCQRTSRRIHCDTVSRRDCWKRASTC